MEAPGELESDLRRIPGVTGARVVMTPAGQITEVHVVAGPGKHPKQLVRDVQTVALAGFGVEIDRRVVSVVQMGGMFDEAVESPEGEGANGLGPAPAGAAAGGPAGDHPGRRVRIESVSAAHDGLRYRVEVTVRRGEEQVAGSAHGRASAVLMPRLVAQATLEALLQIEPVAPFADVESASVVRLGEREVALVALCLLAPSQEEVVTGSAPVRAPGVNDAVARAVLDATNRRFPWLVPAGPTG